MSRGQNRSARSQPERFDEVARVGNLHLHFFARAEPAGLQFLHILRLVDQQDVLVSGGLGFEEIRLLCNGGGDEPVADEPVFLRREDMAPDGEVVGVAINEFEREHGDNPHPARSKGWPKSFLSYAAEAETAAAEVPGREPPAAKNRRAISLAWPLARAAGSQAFLPERWLLSTGLRQRWLGLALPSECIARILESGAAFLPCVRAFAE